MTGRARAQQSPELEQRAVEDALRGEAAKALAENSLLRESIDALERSYIDLWQETDPTDTDGRERLYMAVRVVKEFRRNLRTMIDNGRLGREHLARMRNGK